jgi:autoinducer 2-degrading protein
MHILLVQIKVKPESVEAFKAESIKNSAASLREPGILRFDFAQQHDDPTRFILYEVYRDASGHAAHKETPHYAAWRDAVAGMMAEPRIFATFANIAPTDANW